MSARKLKNVASTPESVETPRAAPAQARLTPDAMRDIAARADPTMPPAIMRARQTSTLLTLRIQTGLADAIADAASGDGTTQKVIITRALAGAGFQVSPVDLEDRTPRRRRAA